MAYPYDAATLAALTRLASYYNGNNYNAGSNPGGMGAGGHRTNFVPSLQDLTLVGTSVEDAADAAATSASAASTSATSSASQANTLTATSTTSLSIGTGSKAFTTQSGKAFNVGSYVQATSDANPTTHFMIGQVTAYTGTALTVNVTQTAGTGSRADWTLLGRSGIPGATGPIGPTGLQGTTVALGWVFNSSTTDSDPGNGLFRFNNASPAATTVIYFDNLDNDAGTQTTWLDALDDSTNTALRGTLYMMQLDDPAKYAVFNVTGAVTDGTGYRKVPVTNVMANGTFTSAHEVGVIFARTGDKGIDGGGAGDTISDIGTVTDGRLVKYNGTTGKHVTDAGFSIGTSGAAIGALSTANTWGGNQTFSASLIGAADFVLSGDITPTQLASNQDNYAPTGIATATILRLSSDASRNITGITTGADGRMLILQNVGSNDIVLINDATSTAANRFLFGTDYTLPSGQSIALNYDGTSLRWRPMDSVNGVAANGSVTRPAYSFASDPNTGWYRAGADVVGLSLGGTQVVQYAAGQIDVNIVTEATSATAASVVFDGGIGVAKSAFIGGTLNVAGTINANGGLALTGALAIATVNLTGGQIAFPSTQAPSANVNTLDDYEEGNFTPAISFGGGSTGITYVAQTGRYTKVGRAVHFSLQLELSSTGAASGQMRVTGLPFAASAGLDVALSIMIDAWGGITLPLQAKILAGTTTAGIYGMDNGAALPLSEGDIGNSGITYLSGTYSV